MRRGSAGISIIEAALTIVLVAIVSIGVLSMLGNNINMTFSQSKTKFEGYKPFNWGSGEASGVPSDVDPKDHDVLPGSSSGGAGVSNTSSETVNNSGMGSIGTVDTVETAGTAGTEDQVASTTATGGSTDDSSSDDTTRMFFGSGTRTFGSGVSDSHVGADTTGINSKAVETTPDIGSSTPAEI